MRRIARKLALGISGLALTISWIGCAHQGLQSPLARWKAESSPKSQAVSAARASHGANASPSKSNTGLLSRLTKRPSTKTTPTAKPVNESALWLEQAAQAEIGGRLKEAQNLYAKVCQAEPGHVLARHRLAVVTTQLDDFPTAWNHYQEALKLAPDQADIWSDAGYCLFRQGDYEQAEKHVREAMKQHPEESRYINNLALIRGVQGHADEALGLFRKCHDEANSLEFMAQIHELRKDPAAAKSARDQAQLARAKKSSQTLAGTTSSTSEALSKDASAGQKGRESPAGALETAVSSASATGELSEAIAPDTELKMAVHVVDELPPAPVSTSQPAAVEQVPSKVAPPVLTQGHHLAIGNQPRALEVEALPCVSRISTTPAIPAAGQGTISIVKSRPLSTPVESLLPIIQPAVMPTAPSAVAQAVVPVLANTGNPVSGPTAQPVSEKLPETSPLAVMKGVEERPSPLPAAIITRAAHVEKESSGSSPVSAEKRFVAESVLMTTIVSKKPPQDVTINQIHAPRTFPMNSVEDETEDPGDAPIFVIRGQSDDAAKPSSLPGPTTLEAVPSQIDVKEESTAVSPAKLPEDLEKPKAVLDAGPVKSIVEVTPPPQAVQFEADDSRQIRTGDVEWFDSRRQQILERSQRDLFRGYCPVALRDARELVDGRPEFECETGGQRIFCSSAEALHLFQSDPARYLPAASGKDLVLSAKPKGADLRGELSSEAKDQPSGGNLAYASWYDGQLYFFNSEAALKEFHAQPENFVRP